MPEGDSIFIISLKQSSSKGLTSKYHPFENETRYESWRSKHLVHDYPEVHMLTEGFPNGQ